MTAETLPFEKEFIDKLPAGIIILKNRTVHYANAKAKLDLGLVHPDKEYSLDELLHFLKVSEREKVKRIVNSEDPLPEISEWEALLPNGEPTWIQLRIAPLNEHYDIMIIRHISKLMKSSAVLNAQQKQIFDLFSKDPNFLFVFKNGCIDFYNRAFIDKLGYTEEEIEEKKCLPTFIVAPEYRKKIAQYLLNSKRKLFTNNIQTSLESQFIAPDETTELELLCKDGKRIPVMAIVKRLYIDNSAIVQGVMVDLTPIRELTELRFDFLTMSQHTLRTPLSNLRGHLDFYTKRLSVGISEEEKETLENKMLAGFQRNLDRLENTITQLNDISAIRQGKFKCTLMGEDFIPILQQAIDELEFYLKRYRVHLLVSYPSVPFIVNVDRIRMLEVLRNIIENAIRFTGHGLVEITLNSINNNKSLQLICQDTGVGISEADLQFIGEPFRTFHSSASQLGLGLYLVKQIISDHNGSFDIYSAGYHQGCKITIELPLLVPIAQDEIETEEEYLKNLIKQAIASQNYVTRMDAVQQLGKMKLVTKEEFNHVLNALEKSILHDKDRTIRNLASKFYTERQKQFEDQFINQTN